MDKNSYKKLSDWFEDRYEEFGDETPPLDRLDDVIRAVEDRLLATPVKYLGAGDNGIAFLASDGSVIKFTIDEREALLWTRLRGKEQSGVARVDDIIHLASSKTGDSLIYVIKVEYVAKPLTPQQTRLVRTALANANKSAEADIGIMSGAAWTTEQYRKRRAVRLVKYFQKIADVDPSFNKIPMMIADLADEHNAYVYDLKPNNFRMNANGDVILVDPSVPDLTGDLDRPEKLMFEEKLELAISVSRIIY